MVIVIRGAGQEARRPRRRYVVRPAACVALITFPPPPGHARPRGCRCCKVCSVRVGNAPHPGSMAHYKDAFDKYGQIDPSSKMAMAPPKVTLYQFAFIAFKIENRLLFPEGEKEQRGGDPRRAHPCRND